MYFLLPSPTSLRNYRNEGVSLAARHLLQVSTRQFYFWTNEEKLWEKKLVLPVGVDC